MRIPRLSISIAVIFFLAAAALSAEDSNVMVTQDKTGKLTIESDVIDSKIYLDGVYRGNAPLSLSGIEPGLHQILVMKEGYYNEIYPITVMKGTTTSIMVQLSLITGMLVIKDIPENTNFELIVDGKSIQMNWMDLREGTHEITIREFGYVDHSETVRIIRKTTTELSGKLEKAAFSASDLHGAKRSFNPDNPSNLGKVDFSFSVTAPGTGRMIIKDATGTKIQTIEIEPFTTWKQNVIWDGTDAKGAKVTDGAYTAILEATDADLSEANSSAVLTREMPLLIDRSIAYPFTASDAGIGSSGPVVSASLLPQGALHLDFGASIYSSLFSPNISVTVSPLSFLEAGIRADAIVDPESNSAFNFTGGLKAGRKTGNAHSAIALVYRAQTASIKGTIPMNRNGLSLSPAFEYTTGLLTSGVYAALTYGNDKGFFNSGFATASLGLSTRIVAGNFSTGAWINGDTLAFGANFRALGAWSTGLSVQCMLPSTNLQVSAECGYRNAFDDGRIAFLRGGFGVLY